MSRSLETTGANRNKAPDPFTEEALEGEVVLLHLVSLD